MAVLNLMKVFTLFQASSCKQGNYHFLTMELVKTGPNTQAWIDIYDP